MHSSLLRLILIYFFPGIILTGILYSFAQPLANALGSNLWFTQVGLIFVFLFLLEGVLAWKLVDSTGQASKAEKCKMLGLIKPSIKELGIALVCAMGALVVVHIYKAYIGLAFMEYLGKIPLFSLPEWHYQKISPPPMSSGQQIILILGMLLPNVFFEELFFRGYLFHKTEVFTGKYTWIVNGLLFIAYHIFQPSITYALFPMGLVMAGYYSWRRNLYGVMLIHFFLNLLG